MGRYDKLLFQILRGLSDANIEFDDLCHLLHHLGFEMRVRGSHHLQEGWRDAENQSSTRGLEGEVYQVRQVRNLVLKYGLAKEK